MLTNSRNIGFGKKPTLYCPIYNIFRTSGSSLVSLMLSLCHKPFVTITLTFATLKRLSSLSLMVSLALTVIQLSVSPVHSETTLSVSLALGLTLAHGLGVTLILALIVCFSLKALWIVCIFLVLHYKFMKFYYEC